MICVKFQVIQDSLISLARNRGFGQQFAPLVGHSLDDKISKKKGGYDAGRKNAVNALIVVDMYF